nr:hypothetical protein [Tanacetum cinerariifolium]
MALCTSLQRQQTQMAAKIKDRDLKISGLKARVKFLEDKYRGTREIEEEFARENQRESEQLGRDLEIARLHAEEELKMMIEDLKGMMQLVPLEEVYVEALQVKHPIIDWEIHSEEKERVLEDNQTRRSH